MSVFSAFLAGVRLAEPQHALNLTLFPLLAEGQVDPGYRVLDEALAAGCARITEVSAGGSVPELRLHNGCDTPVLLLDGEELVGAKQNRILNLSLLVASGQEILIPVSCVEAGRWAAQSAEFAAADRAHYASGRAAKMEAVSEGLRSSGRRSSDQQAVWADIAEKSERLGAASPTQAAAALYETHHHRLEDYLRGFTALDEQCGALFAIGEEIIGLDLFDCPRTLHKLLPKLIRSLALDAIDQGGETGTPSPEAAERFLQAITQAEARRFPALGMGDDVRLGGAEVTGGALEVGERLIHLCAFRRQAQSHLGLNEGRMARASERRRRFE